MFKKKRFRKKGVLGVSIVILLAIIISSSKFFFASEITDRGFSEPPANIKSIQIGKLLDINGTGGEYLTSHNLMQISSSQNVVSGSSLVSKVPIDLSDDFEASFYVYLGTHQKNMNDTSDGATFFLTNSPRGSKYIGIGQYGLNAYSPNTNDNSLIAVEFDTFYNNSGFVSDEDVESWEDELLGDHNGSDAGHVAIRTQNSSVAVSNHLAVKYGTGDRPLADGKWHQVNIRWNSAQSTITVNYDAFSKAISATIDLDSIGMSHGEHVYFGFSGATGNGTPQGMIFTKLPTQESPGVNVDYKDEANNLVQNDEVKGQIGQEVNIAVNKYLGSDYKYDRIRTLAKNSVTNVELIATKQNIEVYYINVGAKKRVIDEAAVNIKREIDNDITLSSAEKTAQKNAIDEVALNAKNAINQAETNDAAEQAKTAGIEAINNQHQAGKPIAEQKQDAKNAIDAEAVRVKTEIDNNNTLTATEKTNQKNNVDQEAANAKTAIDNATTADTINQAENSGKEAINNQYQAGKSIAEQKQDAKNAIDAEAARVKTEIDNDDTLTAVEKNNQKNNVDQEVANAKTAINNATTADTIKQAETNGKEAINNQHQAGKSVSEQKQDSKNAIDEEAARVKTEIDNDTTLTADEKTTKKIT